MPDRFRWMGRRVTASRFPGSADGQPSPPSQSPRRHSTRLHRSGNHRSTRLQPRNAVNPGGRERQRRATPRHCSRRGPGGGKSNRESNRPLPERQTPVRARSVRSGHRRPTEPGTKTKEAGARGEWRRRRRRRPGSRRASAGDGDPAGRSTPSPVAPGHRPTRLDAPYAVNPRGPGATTKWPTPKRHSRLSPGGG